MDITNINETKRTGALATESTFLMRCVIERCIKGARNIPFIVCPSRPVM